MRLAFHSNQLGLRGTEVMIYDYAHYAETLLGHSCIVIYDRTSRNSSEPAIQKFKRRFAVFGYETFDQVDSILAQSRVDRLHMTKSGEPDGKLSRSVPTLIHAVFPQNAEAVHGDRYAFVSEWLSQACSGGALPWVPGMINLPATTRNLRSELAIPADAFVVGCLGGEDSFDIPFVQSALIEALERRNDLYAIFMNVAPFAEHTSLRFLPGNPDLDHKAAFITTCDAMLHGRQRGETFGNACAEFSAHNRPVLTYALSPERSHIEILGDAALLYKNRGEALDLLLCLTHDFAKRRDWDRYTTRFSPQAVMNRFERVFLSDERMSHPSFSLRADHLIE